MTEVIPNLVEPLEVSEDEQPECSGAEDDDLNDVEVSE